MSTELGHFALILAFCLTLPQAFFGLAGAHTRRDHWMQLASRAAVGHFVFAVVSFGCLAYAFLQDDFSVLYVASNSNSALPTFYKFAAVWGAHEGSLLLWVVVQAIWTFSVVAFSGRLPNSVAARVIGVLGLISAGFGLFILTTSSPFERLWPAALDGRDLNPLLQDPGLVIHPPMQYTGYIGMSVPFAFAIAAMLEGKLDSIWARWVRPWATFAWIFLTIGITLGSWWAYYELGWGGWWFWDPVENASFMPWLIATALIHSLAATEKRGLFKSWTLLLSITGFSLSVLGTFMVRSGVIESVHAFANDPERGVFILMFLGVCTGGALILYAMRAPLFRSNAGFAPVSRESFLLLNNVLLVAATALILLGTLYPLFLDAFNLGKISVGPPYFAIAFVIPMLPLALLLAPGMHASWKKATFERHKRLLGVLLLVAVILGVSIPTFVYGWHSVLTVVGIVTAVWVALASLVEPVQRLVRRQSLSASVIGMSVAHFGLALFIVGATTVESWSEQADLSLKPGQSASVGEYTFAMTELGEVSGPNYEAVQSEVVISRGGEQVAVVHPQKRIYRVQKSPMTEAGIAAVWNRHLLVSMGEPLGDDTWSVRLQYKPMVRFIWMGAFVMALGGFITAFDRRYRRRVAAESTTADSAGPAAAEASTV
jgi:cytochrome c-type biogenesis protein CcmF